MTEVLSPDGAASEGTARVAERARPGRRAERRPELLAVAIGLFYEKGYDRTTLQDIADVMGFTKPAVYYYARNKEELLLDVYRAIVDPTIETARELAAGPGDGATRFLELVERHLRVFLENIQANAVFEVQRSSLSPEAAEEVRRKGRDYGAVLSGVYREGIRDGSLRDMDPAVAVNAVLGMCNSVHRWFDPAGRRRVDEVIDELTAIVTGGVTTADPD